MESLKQFVSTLNRRIRSAINDGDVFRANEITANLMLGSVILMMEIISIVCLILNELGIFTADKAVMRVSILICILVETPILIYSKVTHGEGRKLRAVMEWGLLAVCILLTSTLGHNVILVMAIPIMLSVRYCDVRFTRKIVVASILAFFCSCIVSAFYGILNLNMYKVEPGTVLTVESTLRQAILDLGVDRKKYLVSLLINDYLPKMMAFSVLGFSAVQIAKKGREMTVLQDDISRKAARIETELNLANEIQASMLPCIFPAFPEHGELELYATNIPAKEVGGDFYDYFRIDDDHVAIVMADVSGKGIGAALFMTISKIVLKNQLQACMSPAAAMTRTNTQLCENNDAGLFVTAWIGIYEISTGILTYTNAGHNPPVILRKNSGSALLSDLHGLFLAGMDDTRYSESQLQLGAGDEIFLYTDGVTEATDCSNQLYGETRLLSALNNLSGKTVKEQISNLLENIHSFVGNADQFDDITMMGMKITD